MALTKQRHQLQSVEDIETYLSETRKIYLEPGVKFESYQELIDYVVKKHPKTIYRNGNTHCNKYRYRSIMDIALLCKTYFNTPFKDVIKHLESAKYQHSYCNTVKRNVYHGNKTPFPERYINTKTEFGNMKYKQILEMCQ